MCMHACVPVYVCVCALVRASGHPCCCLPHHTTPATACHTTPPLLLPDTSLHPYYCLLLSATACYCLLLPATPLHPCYCLPRHATACYCLPHHSTPATTCYCLQLLHELGSHMAVPATVCYHLLLPAAAVRAGFPHGLACYCLQLLHELGSHMALPSSQDLLALGLGYAALALVCFLLAWLYVVVRLWRVHASHTYRQVHRRPVSQVRGPGGGGGPYTYRQVHRRPADPHPCYLI